MAWKIPEGFIVDRFFFELLFMKFCQSYRRLLCHWLTHYTSPLSLDVKIFSSRCMHAVCCLNGLILPLIEFEQVMRQSSHASMLSYCQELHSCLWNFLIASLFEKQVILGCNCLNIYSCNARGRFLNDVEVVDEFKGSWTSGNTLVGILNGRKLEYSNFWRPLIPNKFSLWPNWRKIPKNTRISKIVTRRSNNAYTKR